MLLYLNSVNSYRPEIVDSIMPLNNYGIKNTCGEGIAALNVGTSGWFDPSTSGSCSAAAGPHAGTWRITGNVLPKVRAFHNPLMYPGGNSYPDNYAEVRMNAYRICDVTAHTDPCESVIGDLALRSDSPYRNQADDGTDPGIDAIVLSERLKCTTSGDARPCVTIGPAILPPTPTPIPTVTPGPSPSLSPSPSPYPEGPVTGTFPGMSPPQIPATIEMENFDRGGEGTGYHEIFGVTESPIYRNGPIEGVDILAQTNASGGFAVFEAAAGEWLEYTIRVGTSGNYQLNVRYASEFVGGTFHIEVDGEIVAGPVTVISTGSWANYQSIFRTIPLRRGQRRIRVVMDTNSLNSQTGSLSPVVCNFDSIIIQPANSDTVPIRLKK